MKEISYVVNNTLGIHARPAALLAQCCVNFKSQVRIYLDEKVADGDNVLQILALGAKKGDTLSSAARWQIFPHRPPAVSP